MNALAALFTPPVVMAIVAALAAIAAIYVVTRTARTPQAIYGRRIAGTMLGAAAIILGGFAWALESWGNVV